MKKKILSIITLLFLINNSVKAEYMFDSADDYTGEAFFTSPTSERVVVGNSNDDDKNSREKTLPPLKLLRLKMQQKSIEKDQRKYELAPTAFEVYSGEVGTSDYASKEIKDDFDMASPDGFESDEVTLDETIKQKKKPFRKKDKKAANSNTENVILDCQKVDYDTANYLVYATGDVRVEFVKQKTVVKADIITFDRMNNTIKAEGNVKILKSGRTITGDYIFVDLNEENALIENPLTRTANVEIKSQKGYIYGDKIVQENGSMIIDDSFPIDFRSGRRGPKMRTMLVPKNQTLTEDMNNGLITFNAKDIKFTQEGEHEIVSIKKPRLYKGDKLIFKTPSVKLYTNKNHDYVETDHWEIGSIRGLGVFVGPGFVTRLPKGSVFKLIPMFNYKSGAGVGAVGRFSSGTNKTTLAYGTSMGKILAYGQQELDDNLFLQYATNSYMQEWFMGRRRPKYGVSIVYDKSYGARDFLLKGQVSSFRHRFDAGYFHDLDFDNNFEKIKGNDIGTSRFKYMAEASQNFYEYKNQEKLTAFRASLVSQLSAGVYGTGDTQVIGRFGPRIHTQYKRWMQDIGYFVSEYEDNTPLTRFDSYRYGKQSLYLREYFRVCRWLTVSWFGYVNLSNDAPNGKTLQENGFYFTFGPDDLKLSLGYDFVRETLRASFEVMMDAKGTKVEYDKFEIVQDENRKKSKKKNEVAKKPSNKIAPIQQKVLDRAIVENVKEHEDVL